MKKVENINLGTVKFVIDEDAYDALENYLGTIENHFNKSEGCEEIMEDIEIRMAELFGESLHSSTAIISMKHVKHVISIMGTPEDFGANTNTSYTERKSSRKKSYSRQQGKRLFRDEDEAVVAGVCSGLAAYFGVNDPVIVRIIYTIASLFLGLPIIAYIILWIIVPAARNANDRLAMRGKPINIDSISKQVEEELYKINDTLEEIGKSFSSKKKR